MAARPSSSVIEAPMRTINSPMAVKPIDTMVIDGKSFAAKLTETAAVDVAALMAAGGPQPGLAVVLVGDDPASQVYVRNKGRQTIAAGMRSFEHRLPATASEAELIGLIKDLNADASVHGILV